MKRRMIREDRMNKRLLKENVKAKSFRDIWTGKNRPYWANNDDLVDEADKIIKKYGDINDFEDFYYKVSERYYSDGIFDLDALAEFADCDVEDFYDEDDEYGEFSEKYFDEVDSFIEFVYDHKDRVMNESKRFAGRSKKQRIYREGKYSNNEITDAMIAAFVETENKYIDSGEWFDVEDFVYDYTENKNIKKVLKLLWDSIKEEHDESYETSVFTNNLRIKLDDVWLYDDIERFLSDEIENGVLEKNGEEYRYIKSEEMKESKRFLKRNGRFVR